MIANQFKVIKTLGSGVTATVKLVEDVNTGIQFACKIMKSGPEGYSKAISETVQKEMTIMTSLKHDNITKVVCIGKGPYDKQDGNEPKDVIFIVMELAH